MDEIQDLVAKGQSFLKDGKFNDALSFFEQALILNHGDPELWNHKGIALRGIGRYEEAMECFNNSLKLDPRDKNAS